MNPAWPLPRWTGQQLAQLRADAASGGHDPFRAALARAKLLSSQGQKLDARDVLYHTEANFPAASIHDGMFRNLLSAAIVVHAPDLARAWLSRRFKLHYALDIDLARTAAPPEVVHLIVRANTARFLFATSLFHSSALESLLNRWADIYPLFDCFMNSAHRVDGEVDVNLGDGGTRPGLAFCANEPGYFLIPDALYMDSGRYRGIRDLLRQMPVNWADRKPMAIWRGSTTGRPSDPAKGWPSLPRIRLCEISQSYPDIIDAGITSVGQIDDPGARDWLKSRGLLREHIPAEKFRQWRYQIDIDGNTNSWPGLFIKLLLGSPVLKIASQDLYRQWYYDDLRAWINYIPVDTEMGDLVEKIAWLRDHDDLARRIGEAGRELAEQLADGQEIARAAPVIAAAIRTAAGAPMADLRFGEGAADNQVLRDGWLNPETDGVNTAGFESRLELPKPVDAGDFVLIADLSPAAPPPRRVTIIGNGEILLHATISERTSAHCPLPRSVASAGKTLRLTFCCPDGQVNASRLNPLDNNAMSIRLHRLRISAGSLHAGDEHPEPAETLTASHSGLAGSVVHDLWSWHGRELPEGVVPRTIRTFFGTILYADPRAGRIRHGPAEQVPRNFFLIQRNDTASLIRTDGDGDFFGVRIRPEQRSRGTLPREAGEDLMRIFAMVPGQCATFGLRGGELFACAEPDGEFTLSRDVLGPWEEFRFDPEAA